MTVWADYRKCPVCFAEIGQACVKLSGSVKGLGLTQPKPHTTRKLRAESARTGGNR